MKVRWLGGMMAMVGVPLVLAACGEDDPENVVWTCTCMFECDGVTEASEPVEGCGSQSDANKAVTDATTSCERVLESSCGAYGCSCQCNPGNTECTPA